MGECKYSGRFVRVLERDGWEIVERTRLSGIVAILAVTAKYELLLVEQHRPPVAARVIELPSGVAGDTRVETLCEAAARELLEETGYSATKWRELFSGPTSPGLTTEKVTLFHASGLTKTLSIPTTSSLEKIEVHAVPLEKIYEWLRSKECPTRLIDFKVFAALSFIHINSFSS